MNAFRLPCAAVAVALLCGADGGIQPINDLPNPYKSIAPWGNLPEGRQWGALNGVAIDRDGVSLWVADRCGANPDTPPGVSPFQYDSCAGKTIPPVLKFDAAGNLVRSFGSGMFIFPHKIYVDRDGNVWVADLRGPNERERKQYPDTTGGKGHTVTKFSPEGRVLMVIGKPGVAGDPPGALNEPTSIVVAPNGDIFISEGHSGNPKAPPGTVARISRFTREGKFVKSFGRLGSGPGEFMTPHDLTLDGEGRLIVADRGNDRVQILDQDGNFITAWKQFGRPSGVAIHDGMLYVADSESNSSGRNPGWLRGIRIGGLKDGKVIYRIPDPQELPGTSAAEGVAVDARGNVYGGEVGPRRLAKHAK